MTSHIEVPSARIAIIGAGLSGLYAAYCLQRLGIDDYVLLEARDRLGGRIETFTNSTNDPKAESNAFDLGPTWFWPDFQREFQHLIISLNLEFFEQYDSGDMMIERGSDTSSLRSRGYFNSPISIRLMNGMGSLIDALSKYIDPSRILLGQQVHKISCNDSALLIESRQPSSGQCTKWHCESLLLALPPRLAVSSIEFSPKLPSDVYQQWQSTPTWMAQQAKYIAVYENPFWRSMGLSGEGRSGRGPLGEIHDASIPGGAGALFGFFNIPSTVRGNVPEDLLRQHCRAQLGRLFGPKALTPVAETIKDWANDPFTSTNDDLFGAQHLDKYPECIVRAGPWTNRLVGIGSEWSPMYPGYLAGAVYAARAGVDYLVSVIGLSSSRNQSNGDIP